jgi:hypothetical protein
LITDKLSRCRLILECGIGIALRIDQFGMHFCEDNYFIC